MNHHANHKLTCIPTSLQPHLLIPAARKAIEVNGRNAPHPRAAAAVAALSSPDSAMHDMPTALRIAVITQKYWHTDGVNLTVYFLDNPPFALRDRILSHMNAWAQTCNVKFSETRDPSAGQVRIARGGGTTGGYWSYVGTDILQITDHSRQTMNLEGFTMNTEDSEFFRVVRHETGHTLGCPHEHMRREEVALIDEQKAITYFRATQGWDEQMTRQQVLTPLDQASIRGTPTADSISIMCYQIPGAITKTGVPILGGTDIDPTDRSFMATIYPKPGTAQAAVAQSIVMDAAAASMAGRATSASEGDVTVRMPNGVELSFAARTASSIIDRVFERTAAPEGQGAPALSMPAMPVATAPDGLDHEPDPHAVAAPGAAPVPAAPQPQDSGLIRRQRGILGPDTDAVDDGDVILTCAVVGHTLHRLREKHTVHYDIESEDNAGDAPRDAQKWRDSKALLTDVVARINGPVRRWFEAAGQPLPPKLAEVGYTPFWSEDGSSRVVGGTGNLPEETNEERRLRYDPPLPADVAGAKLYDMVKGKGGVPLGYQGRGAYTGFVQGREGGQTNAFSTYRFVMPTDRPRWLPSEPVRGALAIPQDDPDSKLDGAPYWGMLVPYDNKLAYWGMLRPYNEEIVLLSQQQGMYLQDMDTRRPGFSKPQRTNIYGYAHGMTQAIYDVVTHRINKEQHPGTPYEIAVGKQTCKLASCFCCAIFMEATGFPASATHLGCADSWAPQYPEVAAKSVPLDPSTLGNRARDQANGQWEDYCKTILELGLSAMEGSVDRSKLGSFAALKDYVGKLKNKGSCFYSGLILDAVTIHESIAGRVKRTLLTVP